MKYDYWKLYIDGVETNPRNCPCPSTSLFQVSYIVSERGYSAYTNLGKFSVIEPGVQRPWHGTTGTYFTTRELAEEFIVEMKEAHMLNMVSILQNEIKKARKNCRKFKIHNSKFEQDLNNIELILNSYD